jgi:hypothetical protein
MSYVINKEHKSKFRDLAERVNQAGRWFGDRRNDLAGDKDFSETEANNVAKEIEELEGYVKEMKEYFEKYTGIHISS